MWIAVEQWVNLALAIAVENGEGCSADSHLFIHGAANALALKYESPCSNAAVLV